MTIAAWIRKQISHDAHPFVQFLKYGVCGMAATCVHVVLFFVFGWFIFPCVEQSDPLVRVLGLTAPAVNDALRARYSIYCNVPTFLISNLVAYVLNILFVFRSGKHHWLKEIGLFYATATISFVVGTGLQWWLIKHLDVATSAAFGANIVVSLMINFFVRKFLIFKS